MKNTMELLNLSKANIKYITNPLGEKNFLVSDEIYKWYCNVIETYFQYFLVELNGEYGLLANLQIPNPDSDIWEEEKQFLPPNLQNLDSEAFFADLEMKAIAVDKKIQNTVVLGKHTGVHITHEFCVFFPVGTDDKVILNDLQLVFDSYN